MNIDELPFDLALTLRHFADTLESKNHHDLLPNGIALLATFSAMIRLGMGIGTEDEVLIALDSYFAELQSRQRPTLH